MKKIRILALLLLAVQGLAWGGFYEGLAASNAGDYATAMREWRPLAEQGDADAQTSLGAMYYIGLVVTQDYKEAVKWFRLAAEQGDADAQTNLGFMYDKGQGVAQDYVQAHKWYNIAGANGTEWATKNRDIVAEKMTPAQIAEALKLAKEWMEKHP